MYLYGLNLEIFIYFIYSMYFLFNFCNPYHTSLAFNKDNEGNVHANYLNIKKIELFFSSHLTSFQIFFLTDLTVCLTS